VKIQPIHFLVAGWINKGDEDARGVQGIRKTETVLIFIFIFSFPFLLFFAIFSFGVSKKHQAQ